MRARVRMSSLVCMVGVIYVYVDTGFRFCGYLFYAWLDVPA